MNKNHLPSAVVADTVFWYCWWFGRYSYSTYPNNNNKTIKQKVSRDKTEQNYGGGTCWKSGADRSNTPNLCCCCSCCYIFGAVAATEEIVWQIIVPLNFQPIKKTYQWN